MLKTDIECWDVCCWNMSKMPLEEFLRKTSVENQILFPNIFKQKLRFIIDHFDCKKYLKYVGFFDLETIKFCISQTLICPEKYKLEIYQVVNMALTTSVHLEQDIQIQFIDKYLNQQKVDEFFSLIDVYLRTVRKIQIDKLEPVEYKFEVEYNEEFYKNNKNRFLDIFIPIEGQTAIEDVEQKVYVNKSYAQNLLDKILSEQQIDICNQILIRHRFAKRIY
ncbi:hypothetical protein pb186bvf_005984 [Paramecium bursaria]